jgi:hypothetical protein
MKKAILVVVCSAMVATAAQGAIITLLSDDFEYADQAAFNANWTGTTTMWNNEQSTSPTHSVKALTTATRVIRSYTESGTLTGSTDYVLIQFSFYDSNGTASAYRQYAELCDSTAPSATGQLIGLGLNNNIASDRYMVRILGVDTGSGASAYGKLDGAGVPTRSTGWHTLAAKVFDNSIEVYVDNVLSKTFAYAGTDRSYDAVRVGSNLTSTQVAYFDDILVQRVPEPVSLVLLGLGSLLFVRRRRTA